jgi:hypothetical protein
MGVKNPSACKPRDEVLRGDLNDAIFAADFGDLIAGSAPKVYKDAKTFFRNTHPARQLCKVVQEVFGRLADPKEGGIALRLSTGYGGGKTHTLMALWHLADNIGDATVGTELLPAAGRPSKATLVAIDAAKAGVPVFGIHGSAKTRSLWGEIFRQLGGERALKELGKADDPEASPPEKQLKALLPRGPVLILLDELVIYMAKLSERGQGNLLGFVNSLISVVAGRPQSALVVTDPIGQAAYGKQADRLENVLAAGTKLDEVFGRKVTDFDPIGDEAARVIIRRLFEKVQEGGAQKASATYLKLYQRIADESPGTLPPNVTSADYAKRIVECYPFHPRLLDTAKDRLGALQSFQKSRGVLRLFARIVRDVWEGDEDYELITAGEINWSSARIQADLLHRLNRDNFKAAVSADVEKHAGDLDGEHPRGVHRRVASALLLESLPLEANSGFDRADLTLAVLRPDEAGPEPAEALDHLVGICWHTYPMAGGRGHQFRYEPNVNRLIEERAGKVPPEDAKSRVLAEAQGYFSGPAFKLAPWPTSAKQVPESAELQLALCESERVANSICAYSDDRDPNALIPRGFQNAIVAVTASPAALAGATDRAKRLLAAEAIGREHKGEGGKLVRDQVQRLMPDLQKQFQIQTRRAFDRVVLAGGAAYSIEEQYQVPEEQMLQRAQGQACLRKFLDAKGLMYQPGDALDVARFVKDVLPGATPVLDKPEVYSAKAVHERFLGAPGLRLLPDAGVVRETLKRAVTEGKAVVRFPDGRAFDGNGCVEGPEGKRRRTATGLSTVPLEDQVYVTLATSSQGIAWVREDAPGYQKGKGPVIPPPAPPSQMTATTWEKVVELAAERPMVELRLTASTPSIATGLIALAQPLGAETLKFYVNVGGAIRDGGEMSFSATDVKPNHPTRPLTIAQTIFNALAEGGSYEAELLLQFGPSGRAVVQDILDRMSQDAPEELRVQAVFGQPLEGAR